MILLLNRKLKHKEKEDQIKAMGKILNQQKVQMEILLKTLTELNTADKIRIINQINSNYSLIKLCKTFNIVRSIYYYRKNNNQAEDKNTQD